MNKLSKLDIEICNSFVSEIKQYCKDQEDFYYTIAQNDDHSEDFVNRIIDMATAFHSVSQFIDICSKSVFNNEQSSTLGDPNTLGQVEKTDSSNTLQN
jgi:hypothetical protein